MSRKLSILIVLVLMSAMAVLIVAYLSQPTFHGGSSNPEGLLLAQPARPVAPFQLVDQDGQQFGLPQLQGHWSLIFLGYTFCPDICPTTLSMLAGVYETLNQIQPLQVVFVSADPGRDSPERLQQFVGYFNPDFIAATAPHTDLYPFTRNLGLAYAIHDAQNSDYYLVDHSASMVLVNPEGNIVATFRPTQSRQGIATVKGTELVANYQSVIESFKP